MFDGDIESEEVDWEAHKDEEKHVGTQSSIGCRVDKVVLGVFIRTPDNPSGVYHRDIKKGSLCAVHGCSLRLLSAPSVVFLLSCFGVRQRWTALQMDMRATVRLFKRHTLDYHFPNPSAQIDLGHS